MIHRENTLKNVCIYCISSDCMLNCDIWNNLYSVNDACGESLFTKNGILSEKERCEIIDKNIICESTMRGGKYLWNEKNY